MAKFKMTFYHYSKGVEFSVLWADEQQYLFAKKALEDLTGGSYGVVESDPDRPDYYVLETEQQFRALTELRETLRNKTVEP